MMMPIVADKVKDSKGRVKQECIVMEDDCGNVGDWVKKDRHAAMDDCGRLLSSARAPRAFFRRRSHMHHKRLFVHALAIIVGARI